jgi:hypothetical protein
MNGRETANNACKTFLTVFLLFWIAEKDLANFSLATKGLIILDYSHAL